jgi:hypothetical protein
MNIFSKENPTTQTIKEVSNADPSNIRRESRCSRRVTVLVSFKTLDVLLT